MIEIELKIEGLKESKKNWNQLIQRIGEALSVLGDSTAIKMRSVIDTTSKHSTGRLSKSILKHEWWEGTAQYVGIGKYSEMPVYWAAVNYGGVTPPANYGYFLEPLKMPPGAGKSGAMWVHTGNSNDFLMIPKKPIQPMNFIQTTVNWIHSIWGTYWQTNVPELKLKWK